MTTGTTNSRTPDHSRWYKKVVIHVYYTRCPKVLKHHYNFFHYFCECRITNETLAFCVWICFLHYDTLLVPLHVNFILCKKEQVLLLLQSSTSIIPITIHFHHYYTVKIKIKSLKMLHFDSFTNHNDVVVYLKIAVLKLVSSNINTVTSILPPFGYYLVILTWYLNHILVE